MKCMFLLCLLTALPAMGQLKERVRTFGNGSLPQLLALYDLDNNGTLSAEELQAFQADRKSRHTKLQTRWDKDGNGKISESERNEAKLAIKANIETQRALRFDDVDDNNDGFLSTDEFRKIAAVESAELSSPGLASKLFKSLDGNQDSQVSKLEFLRKLNLPPPTIDRGPLPKRHRGRTLKTTENSVQPN